MPSLPAGTRQSGSISYLDAGNERGSVAFWLPVITSANEAAQSAAWATLLSAVDAITLGARVRDSYVDETTYAAAVPTNGAARELSLQIIARDASTGQTVRYNIPTLSPQLVTYISNYGAKDAVVLDDGAYVEAIKDALDAMPLKNPYNYSNNMTVVGARVVRGLK